MHLGSPLLALSQSLSPQSSGVSQVCSVCQKRLYVMERLSAEGFFFHRGCFQCCQCRRTLRLGNYSFNQSNGESFIILLFIITTFIIRGPADQQGGS